MLYRYFNGKGVLLSALVAAAAGATGALLAALRATLGELSLDGFLLGVGNLAVLVGVELLHELSLALSLLGLELGLHLGLLLFGQLGALTLGTLLAAATGTTGTLLAALRTLGTTLLELSLGGFLLSVGNLTVLVGVELLHELSLHLGLAGLSLGLHVSLDGFLLGVGDLAVLVGVELLHELGLHLSLLLLSELGTLHLLHAAGLLVGAAGLLGALLGHDGHGGEQGDKQSFLHNNVFSLI